MAFLSICSFIFVYKKHYVLIHSCTSRHLWLIVNSAAFCFFLIWGKAATRARTLAAPSIPGQHIPFFKSNLFSCLSLVPWIDCLSLVPWIESLFITERYCVYNSVAGALKYRLSDSLGWLRLRPEIMDKERKFVIISFWEKGSKYFWLNCEPHTLIIVSILHWIDTCVQTMHKTSLTNKYWLIGQFEPWSVSVNFRKVLVV